MHHRGPLIAAGTALFTIGAALAVAASSPAGSTAGPPPRPLPVRVQQVGSLDGLNATAVAGARWEVAVEHERMRQAVAIAAVQTQAAATVAARRRSASVMGTAPSAGGAATGSCEAMKPPGFPDWIIQRESRGTPSAVNSSSGALGCVQIMPQHFGHWPDGSPGTCLGLSYAACWAKLWQTEGMSPWR